jgi:hypothetical protein
MKGAGDWGPAFWVCWYVLISAATWYIGDTMCVLAVLSGCRQALMSTGTHLGGRGVCIAATMYFRAGNIVNIVILFVSQYLLDSLLCKWAVIVGFY